MMNFTSKLDDDIHPEKKKKIIKLLSESLTGDDNLLQRRFHALMNENFSQKTYTIIDESDDIASVLIYFKDTLLYQGSQLSVIYLSHLATAARYRGSGITREIMDHVEFSLCTKNDLIYGYPRRAIQGFWSKIGFSETTNGNTKSLNFPKKYLRSTSNFIWTKATYKDIPALVKIANESQNSRLIKVCRDVNKWRHIFLCQENFEFNLLICKSIDEIPVAYCAIQGETIIELCALEIDFRDLINLSLADITNCQTLSILNRGLVVSDYKLVFEWVKKFGTILEKEKWDLVLFSKHKELLNSIISFESSGTSETAKFFQTSLGSNFLSLDSY
jgi:hypothetical protein